MISLNRLSQIIPPDQALANKALSVALSQITGIPNSELPTFAKTVTAMQTTRDLPLITALTTAVPPSVANYIVSTLGVGGGPNGQVAITDIIGLAAGWVATDAFARTVEIFSTMNLTTLTLIYDTMYRALDGDYGDTEAGPLTIPSGRPCAGTYNGTANPTPPPDYDPTAVSLAMACLTGSAATEIANLQSAYPNQTAELNTLWNNMAAQVVLENTLQPVVNLDYDELTANDRNSIYGFVFGLPNYGLQTEQGGMAWFVENTADLATLGGQAIVAALREGANNAALGNCGITTNSSIPSDPNPPPPQAELLPSEYSNTEAKNLVIT